MPAEENTPIKKMRKNPFDFTIKPERREKLGMERSLFGLFTAFLCGICVLCAVQAFRKKRFGLAILFLLNAFTNLVNSIHAIYGFYSDKIYERGNTWLSSIHKSLSIAHFVVKTKKKLKIIAGNNVFICNECVELAQEIIREELAEEVLTDLADTPKPQELLNILNNYVIGQRSC